MLLDVVKVESDGHYGLLLTFENNERRYFDMEPYLAQKPWIRIQPQHLFRQVFIENGTVAWPGNIDMAPETLYDLSVQVTPCPAQKLGDLIQLKDN